MKYNEIIKVIAEERERQDTLHPEWKGNTHGLVVLAEEFGEVAKALYELDTTEFEALKFIRTVNLKEELVQVAAVCVRWLENIE